MKHVILAILITLATKQMSLAEVAPPDTTTQNYHAASGYSSAARSFLEDFVVSNGERSDNLNEAAALAKLALDIEPYHEEGLLAAAIAFSFMARDMSAEAAYASGHGPRARALAEAILSVDPDDGQAHGFLAVWHLEVFVKGGSFGAAALDASRKDAVEHYAIASNKLPNEAGLHWQYARSLALLGAEDYADQITKSLQLAVAAPARNKVDRVVKERASELLKLIVAQEWTEAKDWAKSKY